jgi:hypothetical protein
MIAAVTKERGMVLVPLVRAVLLAVTTRAAAKASTHRAKVRLKRGNQLLGSLCILLAHVLKCVSERERIRSQHSHLIRRSGHVKRSRIGRKMGDFQARCRPDRNIGDAPRHCSLRHVVRIPVATQNSIRHQNIPSFRTFSDFVEEPA